MCRRLRLEKQGGEHDINPQEGGGLKYFNGKPKAQHKRGYLYIRCKYRQTPVYPQTLSDAKNVFYNAAQPGNIVTWNSV